MAEDQNILNYYLNNYVIENLHLKQMIKFASKKSYGGVSWRLVQKPPPNSFPAYQLIAAGDFCKIIKSKILAKIMFK